MRRGWFPLRVVEVAPWVLVLLGLAPGCDARRATAEDCRAIFDRIVAIELRELGYRDPVLEKRKRAELSTRFRSDVFKCVGRRLPDGALPCVARAKSTEELSHECLR